MPSKIYSKYDVVVVPFPFIDKPISKRRPALVLSSSAFNRGNHSIMAMITTKRHPPWPGDSYISGLEKAGLKIPCIVRLKLFTLDNRIILKKIGYLTRQDATQIEEKLSLYLIN